MLNCSLGFVIKENKESDLEKIYIKADQKMYHSKNKKKIDKENTDDIMNISSETSPA